MGFVLSILYFVTSYLTPGVVFGPLAQFRVELILAVMLFFLSLPKLSRSFILKTPQSFALLGLAVAVLMSVLVGAGWAGGGLKAFLQFIPNAYGYFLVCLHCNTKKKLQVLVLMLMFVCLFVIGLGGLDLYRGVGTGPVQAFGNQRVDTWNAALWGMEHPYIYVAGSESGLSWVFRLKGLGLLDDPNDFGQLTVCVIPLAFHFLATHEDPSQHRICAFACLCIASRRISHTLARRAACLDRRWPSCSRSGELGSYRPCCWRPVCLLEQWP